MLISSMSFATGSFFHHDGEETVHKVVNHSCLISTGFTIDTVVTVSMVIVGLIAFSGLFAHTLGMLPLSVKIILISSGSTSLIVNITYTYYRFKKISDEQKKQVSQLEKQAINQSDEQLKILSENGMKVSEYIEYLEQIIAGQESALKDFTQSLQTVNQKMNQLELSEEVESKQKKALEHIEELKLAILSNQHLLEYCRAKQADDLLKAEEIKDENQKILKELKTLKKELS